MEGFSLKSKDKCVFCSKSKVLGPWEELNDGQLTYRICPKCTQNPNYIYWKSNLEKRKPKPVTPKMKAKKVTSTVQEEVEIPLADKRLLQEFFQ